MKRKELIILKVQQKIFAYLSEKQIFILLHLIILSRSMFSNKRSAHHLVVTTSPSTFAQLSA